ncbi:HTH-type transcriptional activator RhaR [Thalassocella blandensis]|nr:HTH-type transcriptional activator RhaR [Thalassocella blandensis]
MKDLILNVHDFILAFTFVESVSIAFLLQITSGSQRQAGAVLSVLILIFGGTLLCNILMWGPAFQHLPTHDTIFIPVLFTLCVLLQGPALFFYYKALTSHLNFLEPRYLLHGIPFLIVSLFIIVFDLDAHRFMPHADLSGMEKFAASSIWMLLKCAPMVYVVASIVYEFKVRRNAKDYYSAISSFDNHLASIVLFGFLLYWLWSFLGQIMYPYLSLSVLDKVGIANNYLGVVLVNILVFFTYLNARKVLTRIDQKSLTQVKSLNLEDEKSQSLIDRIEVAIKEQKVYLDSGLNLERFSVEVDGSPKKVSQIINQHYQSNFYEFINGYRIAEAKELLLVEEHRDKTILDIAFISGFNSHSTFHRFFKRIVGMTPSEFRIKN